jgi:hypothetical protein
MSTLSEKYFFCALILSDRINIYFLWVCLFFWRDNINRKIIFLWDFLIFLCGFTHTKIIFNLGNSICVCVHPSDKCFFVRAPSGNCNFSVNVFLCVFFWRYTHRKIYFWRYVNFSVRLCTHRPNPFSSSAGDEQWNRAPKIETTCLKLQLWHLLFSDLLL